MAEFPLLHLGASAFEAMFATHLSDLCGFFKLRGLSEEMLATGILAGEWLSLFSRWMPFPRLWAVFEFVEGEGFAGIVALTLAVLEAHQRAVLEAADFTALFAVLKDLRWQPRQPTPAKLIARAEELVPAAREALQQAESWETNSSRTQVSMSITRSGSRVVHISSEVEVVTMTESKGALISAARGVHNACETIYETINDTMFASKPLCRSPLGEIRSIRVRSGKLPICGCRQAPSDDDEGDEGGA